MREREMEKGGVTVPGGNVWKVNGGGGKRGGEWPESFSGRIG